MRVLHIVECYEAGVGLAVNSYIKNTPRIDHHLLYSGSLDPALVTGLRSSRVFHRRGIGRVAEVVAAVREIVPDVVHAHSSWAGLYARTSNIGVPIVYQPHGFAFESRGRPLVSRWVFRAVEGALASRTVALAALTDREEELMQDIAPGAKVNRVVNVAACDDVYAKTWRPAGAKKVAMVGRIGTQKAPAFYGEVARRALALDPTIEFLWIGDGDRRMRDSLESCSVRVTGWLTADEVAEVLGGCSIYFHSANYEGFPLSVLDAAKVGLPIVVRSLPAFLGTGLAEVQQESDAASLIARIVNDRVELCRYSLLSGSLTVSMSPESQAQSLERLYAEALK